MFEAREITVYVPYYNAAATIEACIHSLQNQTISFSRLVIIDDGSEQPLPSGLQVEVIKHERNMGLAVGRNTALKNCQTPLIASIDADVVVAPDWLEILLKTLNESKAAGVAGCMTEHFQENTGDRWRACHMAQNWGQERKLNPRFLFGANTLFKVSALNQAGGYDELCRTNNEDRTISEALYDQGESLVYNPGAECRHLRRDTTQSILRAFWGWHHAKGVKEGDFKTPEGLLSRVTRVNFGIGDYRYGLDKAAKRHDFLILDLLLPLAFCCYDLNYYARTTGKSIPAFQELLTLTLPFSCEEINEFLPAQTDRDSQEEWHGDYLKCYAENARIFMTKEHLKELDFKRWIEENINRETADIKL